MARKKVTHKAVCPKCGCEHLSETEWTGRGTFRQHCPRCRRQGREYDTESAYWPGDCVTLAEMREFHEGVDRLALAANEWWTGKAKEEGSS